MPVGTAARLAARIAEAAPHASLAWNPEFLREGFAVKDTLEPDRLVYGVADDHATSVLDQIYRAAIEAGTPRVVTDYATAELVKVAANAFLATKISFINAMSEIADATGADVTALADAIGHDARIGRRFLNAGVGFGGGCLPKDIRAFTARAEELGRGDSLAFLREVDEINLRQRQRVVDLAVEVLGGSVHQKRIAVLGVTFKPESDDVRDSPALDVAVQLKGLGAEVIATDPEGIENARGTTPAARLHDVDPRGAARRRPRRARHRVERVPQPRPRRDRRSSWPRSASSTAATCSTRPRGAPPGGRTADSDARSVELRTVAGELAGCARALAVGCNGAVGCNCGVLRAPASIHALDREAPDASDEHRHERTDHCARGVGDHVARIDRAIGQEQPLRRLGGDAEPHGEQPGRDHAQRRMPPLGGEGDEHAEREEQQSVRRPTRRADTEPRAHADAAEPAEHAVEAHEPAPPSTCTGQNSTIDSAAAYSTAAAASSRGCDAVEVIGTGYLSG